MIRRPPGFTRTDTLFPYTTLFRSAVFGKAEVHTRPVAGGLRIERLQTRAPGQRIDVGGEWLGRGASARTHLKVDVDSEDFGALLAGRGYGGGNVGGGGKAPFDRNLPGSPAGIRLHHPEGRVTTAARGGQMGNVEPGAGHDASTAIGREKG